MNVFEMGVGEPVSDSFRLVPRFALAVEEDVLGIFWKTDSVAVKPILKLANSSRSKRRVGEEKKD